jgi:hypothetical protein
MEQEPMAAITTDQAGTQPEYEAPCVETVLGTADLEREVMQGIISQQM